MKKRYDLYYMHFKSAIYNPRLARPDEPSASPARLRRPGEPRGEPQAKQDEALARQV
jgi:hypothetical protein